MKDGIGEGSTRADHQEISNQNYDAYSRAQEVRALAGIVGKAGLTPIDLNYMNFGDEFEKKMVLCIKAVHIKRIKLTSFA